MVTAVSVVGRKGHKMTTAPAATIYYTIAADTAHTN